MLYKMTNT